MATAATSGSRSPKAASGQGRDVVAHGPAEVLHDDRVGRPGHADGGRDPLEVVAEQGDVTVGQRGLRPAADGAPDVGRGQGRGVVDPVADHHAPAATSCAWPSRASTLPAGLSPLCASPMPSSVGHGAHRRLAVAAQDGRREAHRAEVVHRRPGLGPQRRGHGDDPDRLAVALDHHDRLAPVGTARPPPARSEVGSRAGTRRLTSTRWPSTSAGHPDPGSDRNVRWPSAAEVRAAAGDGHGDGMLALGLDRRGQRQHLVLRCAGRARPPAVTSAWRSVRVPVLSKTTPSTLARRSRTSPLRTKMPSAAARPHPTIMATGAARPMAHGQATSSTARPLSTALPRLPTTSHQTRKVTRGADEHGGDEDAADPVGEPLERGLVPLGVLHQPLQAGQHRLGGHRVDPDHQDPAPVAGPAGHLVPGPPVHRERLAGQHRLVDRRPARHHRAVEGEGLAGPDPDQRADRDALRGDQLALVVVRPGHHPGRRAAAGTAASAWPGPPGPGPGPRSARPVTRMATMSGAITPCSRAANAPLPPRWRCRPPRAMASTALTARAARVPRAMRVSMLVAPWRSSRALSRRNGQPPAISTAMARTRTVHPASGRLGCGQGHDQGGDGQRPRDARPGRPQWSGSRVGRRRSPASHRRGRCSRRRRRPGRGRRGQAGRGRRRRRRGWWPG